LLEGGRVEYTLKDHLGNGRVYCYHDSALNQAKTIQEAHYYPFGLPIQKLSPNFEASVGVEVNLYQYNGIEVVDDFGLHVNHALYRTLDPQTGRWWQIDPMAEKFYPWSPYNSNLDNPVRYNDPKGDCPPWVCGALAGAAVEYGFQVAENYYNGKSGLEMVTPQLDKIGTAFIAGALTGGFSTLNKISNIYLKVTVNRIADATVGTGESIVKQNIDVQSGKEEAISITEAVIDGGISAVTGGWGEGSEMAAKNYLQKEFSNTTQATISGATEFQENSYQRIVTATINENNTPKNPSTTSQPTNTYSNMPATGNKMVNPQPISQPDIF